MSQAPSSDPFKHAKHVTPVQKVSKSKVEPRAVDIGPIDTYTSSPTKDAAGGAFYTLSRPRPQSSQPRSAFQKLLYADDGRRGEVLERVWTYVSATPKLNVGKNHELFMSPQKVRLHQESTAVDVEYELVAERPAKPMKEQIVVFQTPEKSGMVSGDTHGFDRPVFFYSFDTGSAKDINRFKRSTIEAFAAAQTAEKRLKSLKRPWR